MARDLGRFGVSFAHTQHISRHIYNDPNLEDPPAERGGLAVAEQLRKVTATYKHTDDKSRVKRVIPGPLRYSLCFGS